MMKTNNPQVSKFEHFIASGQKGWIIYLSLDVFLAKQGEAV
jgi:hypothetical protein